MPTIEVSEETYRKLEREAARLHKTVPEVAEPRLDFPDLPTDERPSQAVIDERLRKFREMIEFFRANAPTYPPGFEADVSRESMYEGCGE